MTGIFHSFRRVHMVGIGGSGMSGIAEVLLTLGYSVTGSDAHRSPVTERLEQLGARVFEGHRPEQVEGAHVVVVSAAIRPDNPEVLEAHRRKIAVIPRAEMLAELMRLKYGIAVAGAHGKTTTTSMVAQVLAVAGLDPTFVIGGRVRQAGTGARVGQGQFMVVEADESDRSFLLLAPVVAVVTTIDREHLDHYRSLEEIQETFAQFTNRVPFYGAALLSLDEPNVQAIIPQIRRPIVTYGLSSQADLVIGRVQLSGLESDFDLTYREEPIGRFHLRSAPGLHNVRNAAAAAAVGLYLSIPAELIRAGLESFPGVARRFEIKGEPTGVALVDDYGHHPAEIRATLEAARGCGYERLLVLFQPHRFSRTRLLWDDFTRAFNDADVLFVVDVYPAGEPPVEGVSGEALAQAIAAAGHKAVSYAASLEEAAERLAEQARPGDAVLALGAGNVGRALDALAARLAPNVSAPKPLELPNGQVRSRLEAPEKALEDSGTGAPRKNPRGGPR